MFRYLKKYWFWCVIAPLFMVGEISMDLLQPDLMAHIVDDGVLRGDLSVVISVGIRMILLVLFGGFCGILCGVFTNLGSQNFGNDLRKGLFARIMGLSFEQTDRISTGSLVTRLSNDVTQVQNTVSMSIRGLVRSSIMFFGGLIMLYRQSSRFALIALCGLPFIAVAITYFLKKAAPLFSKVQERLDGVNNVMQENVAGARVVKAYVRELYELSRFDIANENLCQINLRVQVLLAFLGPCLNIVLNLCVVAVILMGGLAVKNNGTLSPGEIMAAITYLSMILNSMMFLANIFQIFTRAKASADRIKEVLTCEDVIRDGGFHGETAQHGTVEFQNVRFAYPNSSGEAVLSDISFRIEKGETFAIMGATGSGKSTLVNLIPRFYDATDGNILVDGVNVKEYDLSALRQRIAIVLQKAELYSRSVEANIRFGKPDADPWEIKRAAEIAQADDFICAMPNGYYTQVTEGGHSLSGGQKQRISIARAVIQRPEIFIFDDSTSALDLKTEAKLFQALRDEFPDTTKIIIAQRVASIRHADRIAVIDGGRIVSCGTHDELMETSELYRDIYHSQLKKGEEADV